MAKTAKTESKPVLKSAARMSKRGPVSYTHLDVYKRQMLRKALEKADLAYVPVISVNLSGLEHNPGFKLSLGFIRKAVFAVFYGDIIMNTANQVRPYEVNPGDTDRAIETCMDFLLSGMNEGKGMTHKSMIANFERIIEVFKARCV